MLVAEGVKFDVDGRVAKESIHWFESAAVDATTASVRCGSRNTNKAADTRPSKRPKTNGGR